MIEHAQTLRAYRLELRPTVEQLKQLSRTEGAARWTYNWVLRQWRAWAAARAVVQGLRALDGRWSDWWRISGLVRGLSRGAVSVDDNPQPNSFAIHGMLTQAKRAQHWAASAGDVCVAELAPAIPWLLDVTAYAPREACADVDRAFRRFFRVLKKHQRGNHTECGVRRDGGCSLGEPCFRSRSRGRRWHADQANNRESGKGPLGVEYGRRGKSATVKIPGVGLVKVAKGQRLPPPGARLSAIGLSERAGTWYASLRFEAPLTDGHGQQAPRLAGSRLGVETGVREIAVTVDHEDRERRYGSVRELETLQKAERKIRLWSRRQARRARLDAGGRLLGGRDGQSRGWHEAVERVAHYHALAADCRKNLLHQTSHAIVATGAETIAVRDQAVKRMLGRGARRHEAQKRNRLAPMIQQCGGLYELRRQVEYKQAWAGGQTVTVPSDEPTTRRCHRCAVVRAGDPPYGPIAHSVWVCDACGAPNEREVNSALNARDYTPPGKPGEDSGGTRRGKPGNGRTAETSEVTGAVAHPGEDSGPRRSQRSGKRAASTGARRDAGASAPATAPSTEGQRPRPTQRSRTSSQVTPRTRQALAHAATTPDPVADPPVGAGPEQASKEGCSKTEPQPGGNA